MAFANHIIVLLLRKYHTILFWHILFSGRRAVYVYRLPSERLQRMEPYHINNWGMSVVIGINQKGTSCFQIFQGLQICVELSKAVCYLQNYSNDFNLTSSWGSATSLEAVTSLAGVTQAKVYHSHGEKIRWKAGCAWKQWFPDLKVQETQLGN